MASIITTRSPGHPMKSYRHRYIIRTISLHSLLSCISLMPSCFLTVVESLYSDRGASVKLDASSILDCPALCPLWALLCQDDLLLINFVGQTSVKLNLTPEICADSLFYWSQWFHSNNFYVFYMLCERLAFSFYAASLSLRHPLPIFLPNRGVAPRHQS